MPNFQGPFSRYVGLLVADGFPVKTSGPGALFTGILPRISFGSPKGFVGINLPLKVGDDMSIGEALQRLDVARWMEL